jgi:hypothetical protein
VSTTVTIGDGTNFFTTSTNAIDYTNVAYSNFFIGSNNNSSNMFLLQAVSGGSTTVLTDADFGNTGEINMSIIMEML